MSEKKKRLKVKELFEKYNFIGYTVYHKTRGRGTIVKVFDLTLKSCKFEVKFKDPEVYVYTFPGDIQRHVLSRKPFPKESTTKNLGSSKQNGIHTVVMKKELPGGKESGKEPEKQTVSNMGDSGSAVKAESPAMNSHGNQPARKARNSGIENLLSEMKQLVDEIRGPLQETFQKQEPHLPSDEQTGPSEAEIKIGDLVCHKKFGKGTVTKIDNEKDSIYIKIHFEKDEGDYPAPFPYPKAFKSGFLTKGGESPAATESSPQDAAETDKNANTTPDSGQIESIENPPSDTSSFRIGDIIYQNYWGWGYIDFDFNSMKMYLQFDTSGRYTSPEELQDLLKEGELFTSKELEARRAEYIPKAKKVIRSL